MYSVILKEYSVIIKLKKRLINGWLISLNYYSMYCLMEIIIAIGQKLSNAIVGCLKMTEKARKSTCRNL